MQVDQATKLRELVKARTKRAKVVAVTSGKGGVGKSNMAIAYALACAELGRRVVMVDVDLGLANLDVLLNVTAKHNLAHVITGRKTVAEVMVKAPGGILLLPGATGMNRLADLSDANREKFIKKLECLEQSADVIVIDTGAGISKNVINFTLSADEVIVVTTPEPTAITDAYAMLKVLSRHADLGDVRLLVNMADSRQEAENVADSLKINCQRFLNLYVEKMGFVRRDQKVVNAVRRRSHFFLDYPNCVASSCIKNMVSNSFENGSVKRKVSGGFFRRLSQLF